MAKSKDINLNLPSVDELFSTQQDRDEANLKKIYEIPLSEIDPFPKHPFKVRDDEDMANLVESIKEQGIITPATVRKKDDGRYELLSGHRRKRACEIAGIDTLRAEVVEMDKDAAIIFMVDSNLQRTTILPSEKAFSYKMRLNAMKRQGHRTDLTSVPVAQKFEGKTSREILGEQVGESQDQVRRYIRLTYLSPQLLRMVDEGEIGMRPAVELSYLPRELQDAVNISIQYEQCTPSHGQARQMRMMHEKGELTEDMVEKIMSEEKPNQKEKVVIRADRVQKLFPKDLPYSKREDYVITAMEYYGKYLQKKSKEQQMER